MASKTRKQKPKPLAQGDSILLEVAKWNLENNIGSSLNDFKSEHEIRIGALVTYGFLRKTDTGKFWLTEQGERYVRTAFPDRFKVQS